ncbi:A-kinase anchor protein 7 isoforms delta and gamma-like [Styela clava]
MNENADANFIRPTHFLAVQITDPIIKGKMKEVQDCIVAKESILENVVVGVDLAHITLCLLSLPNESTVNEANKILQRCRDDLMSILDGEPMNLHISGIGHFDKRVVFAKVVPGDNEEKLKLFSEHFDKEFALLKSTNPFEYTPHVTLMKLSKLRSFAMKKKIKQISPKHFEDIEDMDFGHQNVKTVQLLAMSRKKATEYYFCESDISVEESNVETTEAEYAEE